MAMPQLTHTPAGPTELGGKYRLLLDLGQGGTANVCLAVARGPSGFSKLVVLKMMRSNLADEGEFSKMFLNEARLSARLNHANIVQTNEVFEHEGRPVLVLEYLEGQSLSAVMKRARDGTRFSLNMQLRVLSDMMSGLHYAHELADFKGTPLGIVHRDISPQNVFITYDGQVKLLDFGIAKLSESHVETATGVLKGKVRYMSPEQVVGQKVDRRTDIFAVGVMLWEAATSTRMWAGLGDTTIIHRLLNEPLPRPSSVNPAVDPELERIIVKATAAEREQRYDTVADLQRDVDELLSKQNVSVRQRDIGAVVTALFEDTRQRSRRLIEAQLDKVATLTDAEYAAVQPPELSSLGVTRTGRTELEPSTTGASSKVVDTQPRAFGVNASGKRKALVLGAIACLGALVAVGFASGVGSKPVQAVAAPPVSPAAVSNSVRLRITGFPAAAKLYLDEQLLPSNPYSQDVPRDTKKHVLRVVAEGHREEQRELTLAEDSEVVVALGALPQSSTPSSGEKVASNSPAKKAAPMEPIDPRRVRSTPIAEAPAKPKPEANSDCSPPYIVDSKGVKRYKPNCF
ncbi:MAG TPA: serine/threonine-protein kinase [Polyangiaceae bacterium]|nr:serine/threonine-protein kinase [Polyangiaceae bacterium]